MKSIGLACIAVVVCALSACSSGGGSSSGSNSSSSSSSGGSSSSSSSTSSSNSSSSGVMSTSSHRAGQNCLESGCHAVGDTGANAAGFYVGGTIFSSSNSPQTSAIVRFYVQNSNELVKTLTTDNSGNFYTADVISQLHIPGGPLVDGLDVEIEGPSGAIRSMPGVVSDAYCNLCHQDGDRGKLIIN